MRTLLSKKKAPIDMSKILQDLLNDQINSQQEVINIAEQRLTELKKAHGDLIHSATVIQYHVKITDLPFEPGDYCCQPADIMDADLATALHRAEKVFSTNSGRTAISARESDYCKYDVTAIVNGQILTIPLEIYTQLFS